MISLLTNKYFIGILIAIGVIFAVFLFGQSRYNDGFETRDLTAKIEMQDLQNQILQKATEERNRQMAANKKAQDLQKQQIKELQDLNEDLENKLKENENEAQTDENRDRIGLDPSSVLRLNRIK